MSKIVMAIIGNGKSANRYHLPYLKLIENITVKYICDPNLSEEDKILLNQEKIIGINDYSIILEDSEVSLVTVCTPPKTHYSIGKSLLMANKNVILEKPFCETLEETIELIELAEQRNVIITPYQNRRFDSDFLTLKKVIDKGYVGELIELEAHIDYYRPNKEYRAGTILNGNFYALGVHAVDQIVSLFGKPTNVSYDLKSIQTFNKDVDDYYEVQLFYSTFKVILKSNQLVAKNGPRFRLIGTEGIYEKYETDQQENDLKLGALPSDKEFGRDTSEHYGKVTYRNQNGDWITKKIPSEIGNYGNFYDAIVSTLCLDKEVLVSKEEILTTMEIMSNAYIEKNDY